MTKPLITVFCGDYINQDILSTKRADLQRSATRDMSRPIITRPADRIRKYAVETGCWRRSGMPDEPWLCTDPSGAMRLYQRILEVPDGTFTLADAEDMLQLEQLAYMADEQLITIGGNEVVHALGDVKSAGRRYPGAPVPDDVARIGRTLRGKAAGLVLAAWANITRGDPLIILRRPGMLRGGGVSLSIRELCAEANAIKAKRPDLAGYRYLSAETCRRVVNGSKGQGGLIRAGTDAAARGEGLVRLEEPVRYRAARTWMTLPAIYELPPDAAEWPAAAAPKCSVRPHRSVRRSIRRLRTAA